MVATHVGYTCIGNPYCRIIRATAISGRSWVQESLNDEWDRGWIGADIATMVAGAEPYGNLKNAALAVKGERIAWIGPAAEGSRKAAALGVPIHDVQGL